MPEHAIDAQSLVAAADLVVSAGGTMNREAVVLGTPVYTGFAGRMGAVDESLIREGRLRRLVRGRRRARSSARRRGRRSACGAIRRTGCGWRSPAGSPPKAGAEPPPAKAARPGAGRRTRPYNRRLWPLPIRHRLANVLIDAGLVALAWYAAFFFRFEELPVWAEKIRDEGLWRVVLIKVVVFIALGLYSALVALRLAARPVPRRPRLHRGERARWCSRWSCSPDVDALPRGVIAFDFVFTLLALIAARALARTIFERPRPGFLLPTGREVLVVGAGEAGQLVVREMLKKRALGYSPTRLLDDDPRKQGMRLEGVRVEGKTTDLDEILESSPPDEVVIAMPGAEPGVRQRIVDVCRRRGVPVKTVPGVNELLDGDLDLLERLRAVQVEDVLGRAPVQLDLAAIGGYLTGRTVLVTGAGGSIGSELCRQIAPPLAAPAGAGRPRRGQPVRGRALAARARRAAGVVPDHRRRQGHAAHGGDPGAARARRCSSTRRPTSTCR